MRAEREREYVDYVRARMSVLRRTAYRLCGDWHRADDLVQVTLVKLYRHWARAYAAEDIDAYTRKILINVFLEDRRRWWSRNVVAVAELDRTSVEGHATTDQRFDLMAALARISAGQRTVLVLRYWEGLSVAETAKALGCGEGTVKSQTSYAVAALRRLLPDYVAERLESS